MEGLGVVYEPDDATNEEEEEQDSIEETVSSSSPKVDRPPAATEEDIDYNDPSCYGKLFVGGLSWDSTEDTIKDHFKAYGPIADVALMTDKFTGKPRGFGFVTFQNTSDLDKVLADQHQIDGRTVEVKKAVPKDKAPGPISDSRGGAGGGGAAAGAGRTTAPAAASQSSGSSFESKKIFVGGLASSVDDAGLQSYFGAFGTVVDAVVMIDRTTRRSRGFGFVTFEDEGAVAEVLSKDHQIHDKTVEIKRAEPKERSAGYQRGHHRESGGGGRGGYGYGYGYGAPPAGGRGGYGYGGGYGAPGGYGYPPPPYGGGYGGAPPYGGGGYGGPPGGYGGYPPPPYGGRGDQGGYGYGGGGGYDQQQNPSSGSNESNGGDSQQQYNSSRHNSRSDRYRPY